MNVMKDHSLFLKQSRGNVAIEFALVLPVIFLLLSGIVNFGFILASKNKLNSVVNAGLLYAYAHPTATPATISTIMTASTTLTLSPAPTATVSCKCLATSVAAAGIPPYCVVPPLTACSDGSTPGTYVTATAQTSVTLYALDFVLTNPFPLTSTGTIRIQ